MNLFHKATLRVIGMFFMLCGAATFLAPVMAFMSVTSDTKKEASLIAVKYGLISFLLGVAVLLISSLGKGKRPDTREKKTSKLAIASLILGIPFIGLPTFLVASVLSIIFAILAFREIYSKETKKGAELAYIGATLSMSTIALAVPMYFVGAG